MNDLGLEKFLFVARSKTYAGSAGKTKSLLPGTEQFEYKDGDWQYRDNYYNGKDGFVGIEGVFFANKPVWSMSYVGHYYGLTEEEADKVLKPALLANPETRGYKDVEAKFDDYIYTCATDLDKSLSEMGGVEEIKRSGKVIYRLYYGGCQL